VRRVAIGSADTTTLTAMTTLVASIGQTGQDSNKNAGLATMPGVQQLRVFRDTAPVQASRSS